MSEAAILLDPSARPVVGHRGAAAYAPENTLPSFELALSQGVDALEMDVHLSADGVPVVIHDTTLQRTTDRAGFVWQLSLDEIRTADAGAHFTPDGGASYPYRGMGVRVPRLDDVLALTPRVPLIVEVKSARASAVVVDLLRRTSNLDRCLLGSYATAALDPVREPAVRTGASRRELMELGIRLLMRREIGPVPYDVLFLPTRYKGVPIPVRAYARVARAIGRPLHMWTIDDPVVARRLWQMGASAMITNRPDVMQTVRSTLRSSLPPSTER